jgi:hypothetical protein
MLHRAPGLLGQIWPGCFALVLSFAEPYAWVNCEVRGVLAVEES